MSGDLGRLQISVQASSVVVEFFDDAGSTTGKHQVGIMKPDGTLTMFDPAAAALDEFASKVGHIHGEFHQPRAVMLGVPPKFRMINWEAAVEPLTDLIHPVGQAPIVREPTRRLSRSVPRVRPEFVCSPAFHAELGADFAAWADRGRWNVRVESTVGRLASMQSTIVGCAISDVEELSERLKHQQIDHRPRLIYTYGQGAEEFARTFASPSGVALYATSTTQPGPELVEVAGGIEDGTLLDEVAKSGAVLISDDSTLHGLNAFGSIGNATGEWVHVAGARDATRSTSDSTSPFISVPGRPFWSPVGVKDAVDITDGLIPSVHGTAVSGVVRTRTDGRSFDARMRPVGSGAVPGPGLLPGNALVADTTYRIDVRIGRPYEASVLSEPAPPIEDDLERGGPWDLEIDVWGGEDFEVIGRSQHPLHLPLKGATAEVTFLVRAARVDEHRHTALHIGIYHQNNLAQMYRVAGTLYPAASVGRGDLSTTLVSRRVAELDDVGRLTERALNVGVAPGSSGALRVRLKAAGADDFVLSDVLSANLVGNFATRLQKAFWLDDEHTRYPDVRPVHVSSEFLPTMREFAQIGNNLADELLRASSRENQEALARLASSSGRIVQVPRYSRSVTLPWTIVYDWKLPDRIEGGAEPEFCLGDHDACTHVNGTSLYCLRGFWGVRHVVEEVLTDRESDQQLGPVPSSAGILLSIDEPDDRSIALMDALNLSPEEPFHGGSAELLDRIWAAEPKVRLVVLLGHYTEKTEPGKPIGSRLALESDDQFLFRSDLYDRYRHEETWPEWPPEPGPVVLLLGCSIGPNDVAGLSTLADEFLDAGASAIVYSIAPIVDAMGYDLGKELGAHLLAGRRLGEAVRAWREDVLRAGNPMALAFVPVGDAETRFAVREAA